MEGMQAFARRHFPSLAAERTHVVCVDTVGSPELTLIEGEGMLRMRDYPEDFKDLVADCARESRRPPAPRPAPAQRDRRADRAARRLPDDGDRLGHALKVPANYHWPTDTAENVDYGTVNDAVTLCTAIARRLAAAAAAAAAPSGTSRRSASAL